jgi:hypothetical protein
MHMITKKQQLFYRYCPHYCVNLDKPWPCKQVHWKNHPSQQLFKVFIYIYIFFLLRCFMFRPSLAILRRSTQLFSGSYLTTTDPKHVAAK